MKNKALLKLGKLCNNNCLFCHNKNDTIKDLPSAEVIRKINLLSSEKTMMIIFSGGEPTIRKDLINMFEHAHHSGFKIGLITNGRMLSNIRFLKRLINRGLGYIYISLHAADEHTHNLITRAQSFKQTVEAIRNISQQPVELVVNCVVNKHNYNKLNLLVDLVSELGVRKLKFTMVMPLGEYSCNVNQETIERYATAVKSAINYGKNKLKIYHEGFPLCHLQGFETALDNFKSNSIELISEAWYSEWEEPKRNDYFRLPSCDNCNLANCEGFHWKLTQASNNE